MVLSTGLNCIFYPVTSQPDGGVHAASLELDLGSEAFNRQADALLRGQIELRVGSDLLITEVVGGDFNTKRQGWAS